jgi:hypothetical protein
MISAPSLSLVFLRIDAVLERLAHLAALAVDGEAVGQQAAVRRAAVQRAGDQQRRVEPAAMLVVAFEVQVGLGPSGWKPGCSGVPLCVPRSTWKNVEPESNHTSRMSVLFV